MFNWHSLTFTWHSPYHLTIIWPDHLTLISSFQLKKVIWWWWLVVVGGGSTHYNPYLRVYFSFCEVFFRDVDVWPWPWAWQFSTLVALYNLVSAVDSKGYIFYYTLRDSTQSCQIETSPVTSPCSVRSEHDPCPADIVIVHSHQSSPHPATIKGCVRLSVCVSVRWLWL